MSPWMPAPGTPNFPVFTLRLSTLNHALGIVHEPEYKNANDYTASLSYAVRHAAWQRENWVKRMYVHVQRPEQARTIERQK